MTEFFSERKVLLEGEGWSLEMRMLHPELHQRWGKHVSQLKLQQRPLLNKIFDGRQTRASRNMEFFATFPCKYVLTKTPFPAVAMNDTQKEMLQVVNSSCDETYNAMVVNEYEDGWQRLAYHSDNPNHLGKHGVNTLSFGETRVFRVRRKVLFEEGGGPIVLDVPCIDGSMLSMLGKFQELFTHEIVREETKRVGPRRSVTFRCMKPEETQD
jgi:hypothetical protein